MFKHRNNLQVNVTPASDDNIPPPPGMIRSNAQQLPQTMEKQSNNRPVANFRGSNKANVNLGGKAQAKANADKRKGFANSRESNDGLSETLGGLAAGFGKAMANNSQATLGTDYHRNTTQPKTNTNNFYNQYQTPGLASGKSAMGVGGASLHKIIQKLEPHTYDLNDFFQDYDVYNGRIFELWEVLDITNHHAKLDEIQKLMDENDDTERLRGNELSYNFLFKALVNAKGSSFSNCILRDQPMSIYEYSFPQMTQQVQQFMQALCNMRDFAGGQLAEGFDRIFNHQPKAYKAITYGLQELKNMVKHHMQGQSFPEHDLHEFIKFVAVRGQACFNKTKFIAALKFLMIKFRSDIALNFFDNKNMPGMPQYTGAGNKDQLPITFGANGAAFNPIMQPSNGPVNIGGYAGPGGLAGVTQTYGTRTAQQEYRYAMTAQQVSGSLATSGMGSLMQAPGIQTAGGVASPMQPGMYSGMQTGIQPGFQPGFGQMQAPQNQNAMIYEQLKQKLDQISILFMQKSAGQFQHYDVQPISGNLQNTLQLLQTIQGQDQNHYQLVNDVQYLVNNVNVVNLNNMQNFTILQQKIKQVQDTLAQAAYQSNASMGNNQGLGSQIGGQNTGGHYDPQLRELLNRICNQLKQQGKELQDCFRQVNQEVVGGKMAYRVEDFARVIEREFHFTSTEANMLSHGFSLPNQRNYVGFASVVEALNVEKVRFDTILRSYAIELDNFIKQLKMRHTGVYNWFRNYMNSSTIDNSLSFNEFDQAIRSLVPQIISQTIQDIFSKIDQNNSGKISIADIESLFKEHNRQSHPSLNPQTVIQGVLRAFNGDIQFIEGELQQATVQNMGILSQEDTVRFLQKYNGWNNYYGEDEVFVLVDAFLLGAGKVNKQQFVDALYHQQRTNPNLQPNQTLKGIHRMGESGGIGADRGQHTSLRSFDELNEDCTQSCEHGYKLTPFPRDPRIRDEYVQELQKACFIRGKTVRDFFGNLNGVRDEYLSKHLFQNGLDELQLTWPAQEVDQIFQDLVQAQNTGNYNQIQAKIIDMAVHFLHKKTIKQLHGDLLSQLHQKSQQPGFNPLDAAFENTRRSNYQYSYDKTCSMVQLKEVLRYYQLFWNDIDVKFLATMYIISGRADDIHYQKLIDDAANMGRADRGQAQGDPNSICNAIRKRLYVTESDMQNFFDQHTGPTGAYTESDFVALIGHRLKLIPDYCTENNISFLWSQIDTQRRNNVRAPNIVKYLSANTKSREEIKAELQKQLGEMEYFEQKFTSSAEFNASGQRLPVQKFQDLLESLGLRELDCKYLTMFYKDARHLTVDAMRFLQDVMRIKQAPQYNENMPGQGLTREEEIHARKLLSQFAMLPGDTKKQFMLEIDRAMRGNSTAYVDTMSIRNAMQRYLPQYGPKEQSLIERLYEKQDDPLMFNIQSFKQELHQMMRNVPGADTTIKQLSQYEQRIYSRLRNILEKGKVETKFAYNLKAMDTLDQGYLNDRMIMQAYQQTIEEIQIPVPLQKLTEAEIKEMCRPINKNKDGFLSYREILIHLYGQKLGEKYFLMDKASLEVETGQNRGEFQLPRQVVNPKNRVMEAIGQKMLNKMMNYEDILKNALGPNNNDYMIDRESLLVAIRKDLEVKMTTGDQSGLDEWFRHSQNEHRKVLVTKFLLDVGLPPQTFPQKKKSNPMKELSEAELKEAQDTIRMIARELSIQNKRPDQLIQSYRQNNQQAGMKPSNFARALRREVPKLQDRLNNQRLTLLVYYLAQEELGMVSFDKLYRALTLRERDPPLKQNCIDQIREAKQKIRQDIKSAPLEVIHLIVWMTEQRISINDMFKVVSNKTITKDSIISETHFDQCCNESNYTPKDRDNLISALLDKSSRKTGISLYRLQVYRREYERTHMATGQNKPTRGLDPLISAKIEKISQWMKTNNYTSKRLHEILDADGNGSVDLAEFINGFRQIGITGLSQKDYVSIFETIDHDNNRFLSLNEFCLYIEGAQQKYDQRISELPREIIEDIERQIMQLFEMFDEDGNKVIDKYELMKTYNGLGFEMDEKKAEDIIRSVDLNNDGHIDQNEFMQLMKPMMQQRLLEQDDKIEDFRSMFRDADQDYSGFLTADEVYTVLLKNGIDLSFDELCELISEFDVDGDAQLNIDEFVAMMNTSSDMSFQNQTSQNAYLKIRQQRRLNVMDVLKALKNMPGAFVPSVFHKKWAQENKNRPSDVLKAQLDPRTMTWRDLQTPITEELPAEMQTQNFRPKIRPYETKYGCEISIEGATGVPLPENTSNPSGSSNFDRRQIVKRAVRIGILDKKKHDYIANVVQVEANWAPNAEDKWTFEKKNTSLNPVLFRATDRDDLNLENYVFVFEFVIYYKGEQGCTELCCGWASTNDLNTATRNAKQTYEIQGGSPTAKIVIQADDVHTKRTGIQGFFKAIGSKIKSQIQVKFTRYAELDKDIRYHMKLLPSCCLVQKSILHFVSAYRNYAGKNLLKMANLGGLQKQPGGSVILSCFPKIIDNIDILEVVAQVWNTDNNFMQGLTANQKKQCQTLMQKMKDMVNKLYPVLFADEFMLSESNHMDSMCHDEQRYKIRRDLLMSALGHGASKVRKPIEEITYFKPFNVRETRWEAWDISENRYETYMNLQEQRGIFKSQSQQYPSSTQNQFQPGYPDPRFGQNNNMMMMNNQGVQMAPQTSSSLIGRGNQVWSPTSMGNISAGSGQVNSGRSTGGYQNDAQQPFGGFSAAQPSGGRSSSRSRSRRTGVNINVSGL